MTGSGRGTMKGKEKAPGPSLPARLLRAHSQSMVACGSKAVVIHLRDALFRRLSVPLFLLCFDEEEEGAQGKALESPHINAVQGTNACYLLPVYSGHHGHHGQGAIGL
ncbi:hypothetical protein N7516_002616 [Penicillium verrucosum]|uniref:uncharacterized protein n=1 Tax=Penicillium verrucosum TaxID=60171 RepID=UPI0025456108|nr:uncharacterized protein N7516_002616 [Penicillium verrucosum]KAJ5942448.1 hypothetical protein N7516_002616 [Penicillium verrucosum]